MREARSRMEDMSTRSDDQVMHRVERVLVAHHYRPTEGDDADHHTQAIDFKIVLGGDDIRQFPPGLTVTPVRSPPYDYLPGLVRRSR